MLADAGKSMKLHQLSAFLYKPLSHDCSSSSKRIHMSNSIFFVCHILLTSDVKLSVIDHKKKVNNCTTIVHGLFSSCDTVFNFENA